MRLHDHRPVHVGMSAVGLVQLVFRQSWWWVSWVWLLTLVGDRTSQQIPWSFGSYNSSAPCSPIFPEPWVWELLCRCIHWDRSAFWLFVAFCNDLCLLQRKDSAYVVINFLCLLGKKIQTCTVRGYHSTQIGSCYRKASPPLNASSQPEPQGKGNDSMDKTLAMEAQGQSFKSWNSYILYILNLIKIMQAWWPPMMLAIKGQRQGTFKISWVARQGSDEWNMKKIGSSENNVDLRTTHTQICTTLTKIPLKTQKIYTILSRISSYSKKIEIELAFQELACQKKTNSRYA